MKNDDKTIRLKKSIFERARAYGMAGDSISDAIENALNLADWALNEQKRQEELKNETSNIHSI